MIDKIYLLNIVILETHDTVTIPVLAFMEREKVLEVEQAIQEKISKEDDFLEKLFNIDLYDYDCCSCYADVSEVLMFNTTIKI